MDVEEDATIIVNVTAGRDPVLTIRRYDTPEQALVAIERALEGFDRGDTLEALLRASGLPAQLCPVANRRLVVSWIGALLFDAWGLARTRCQAFTRDTRTQLIVQPRRSEDTLEVEAPSGSERRSKS